MLTAMTTHVPHGITQCTALPVTQQWWHSRLYPSQAGTRFSHPRRMQG